MVMAPIDRTRPRPFPPIDVKPMPMPQPFPLPRPLPINPGIMDEWQFNAQDKNGDGNLSLDEWVRSKKGEITMADIKKFERYDADGDGKVSKAEYKQAKAFERWINNAFDGIKDGWNDHIRPLSDKLFKAKEA